MIINYTDYSQAMKAREMLLANHIYATVALGRASASGAVVHQLRFSFLDRERALKILEQSNLFDK